MTTKAMKKIQSLKKVGKKFHIEKFWNKFLRKRIKSVKKDY